ncbi:hypothetical protein N0V88_007164 [Collariella sp. IMI 366227]|nr:hypothetical protein N0V88_007164 [Collariella sp. IMI 366227]
MELRERPAAGRRQTISTDGNGARMQRQYLWNTPNGSEPNFSETYAHGDKIVVSWNALNNSIYDLWLTSWELDPDPVARCIAKPTATNLGHRKEQ